MTELAPRPSTRSFPARRLRPDAATRQVSDQGFVVWLLGRLRAGELLPYPFSDPSRWDDIVTDHTCPLEWREAARVLRARYPDLCLPFERVGSLAAISAPTTTAQPRRGPGAEPARNGPFRR